MIVCAMVLDGEAIAVDDRRRQLGDLWQPVTVVAGLDREPPAEDEREQNGVGSHTAPERTQHRQEPERAEREYRAEDAGNGSRDGPVEPERSAAPGDGGQEKQPEGREADPTW
jgi:hypothetical protein